MKVLSLSEIEEAINYEHILKKIEDGLVAYTKKEASLAPVSFLHFHDLPADVHIKAGASRHTEYYVVKIASSFYRNPEKGLPSSNGMMALFSKNTGELVAVLHDEGKLTDIRTGIAGAIATKHIGPKCVEQIGIIGTGTQARHQLHALQCVTSCTKVLVWGRDPKKGGVFLNDFKNSPFQIQYVSDLQKVVSECNLLITTTPSSSPLLFGEDIMPGTHITAVGTDGKGKQELDASVFEVAEHIVVDSFSQCSEYGDLSYATNKTQARAKELGQVISNPLLRTSQSITVADLTGIAIEDLMIAQAVYEQVEGVVKAPR